MSKLDGKAVHAALDEQLKNKGEKRDVDVKELYFADRNIDEIVDLSRFRNLTKLWLNNNKLRRISCLSQNFRLSELYLNHNQLVSIQGALRHLTCLEKLSLHNNQLEKLEIVVGEFSKMQHLKVLNLFNNPVAQEQEYRVYVVHHVPSIQLFDRHEVLKTERDQGRRLYDQVNEHIKDSVAFLRRSEGPPALYYPRDTEGPHTTEPVDFEIGNNFYRDKASGLSPPANTPTDSLPTTTRTSALSSPDHTPTEKFPAYSSEDQAVNMRALRRSVMEFSHFDWTKVPRAEERRLKDNPAITPQIITTQFR